MEDCHLVARWLTGGLKYLRRGEQKEEVRSNAFEPLQNSARRISSFTVFFHLKFRTRCRFSSKLDGNTCTGNSEILDRLPFGNVTRTNIREHPSGKELRRKDILHWAETPDRKPCIYGRMNSRRVTTVSNPKIRVDLKSRSSGLSATPPTPSDTGVGCAKIQRYLQRRLAVAKIPFLFLPVYTKHPAPEKLPKLVLELQTQPLRPPLATLDPRQSPARLNSYWLELTVLRNLNGRRALRANNPARPTSATSTKKQLHSS